MQLTLKKASEVARRALMDNSAPSHLYRFSFVDEFRETFGEYQEREQDILDSVAKRSELISAAYALRDIVSAANHQSGVNSVLAKIAEKNAIIEMLNSTTSGATSYERYTESALQARARQYRSNPSDNPSSIMLGVLSKANEAVYRDKVAALTKEVNRLRDELTALNFSTKVTITDEMAATLDSFI